MALTDGLNGGGTAAAVPPSLRQRRELALCDCRSSYQQWKSCCEPRETIPSVTLKSH